MNLDRDELDAIADLLTTAQRHVATGNSTVEVCRLLRLVASKAAELAELVEEDSRWVRPWPGMLDRLRPDDEFADVIDEWGDHVPEGWL